MKGIHQVTVETKRIRYRFSLRRNITVVRGDSATGKTTLIEMIQQYTDNPSGSPVSVRCDKPCYVLSGALWKNTLSGIHDAIVFIDEGSSFVETVEFADTISHTDNYYVIVTRQALPALPYSAEEIYGIHEAGKYGTLRQTYNEFYRIYGADTYSNGARPEELITEDSNSGYQFFSAVCEGTGTACRSANGKSNIFGVVSTEKGNVLVIADGAAFGPEMDRMMRLARARGNIALYLPESFEWLILKAGLFKSPDLSTMLENPSEYVESSQYFSWERFFTHFLIQISAGTWLQYSKRKINENYLTGTVKDRILKTIPVEITDPGKRENDPE